MPTLDDIIHGLLGAPPPPMAPASSPLAAWLNLRGDPAAINASLSGGQAGADFRQATGDFASNQLAAGADPSLPPLSGLWQQGMQPGPGTLPPGVGPGPAPAAPGQPGYLTDLMTQPRPSVVPQFGPDLPYAAPNQGLLDQYTSGQGAPLTPPAPMGAPVSGPGTAPGVGGDVTDLRNARTAPGGALDDAWNSILGYFSTPGDPSQNAEIGPPGGTGNPLWDIFGIGKDPNPKPPVKGYLDQYADQMNANQPKGGGTPGPKGSGRPDAAGGFSTSLGSYTEPPPAPHERVPAAIDLSGAMSELEAARPERVPLGISKADAILGGIAQGMASHSNQGFGSVLLGGAAGGYAGQAGLARESQRDEENYQRAMQDFHYRVAEGKVHEAQAGSEHDRQAAEIDYRNQSNDYQRAVGIIDAHKPEAQMTAGGLVVKSIDPKTGQYKVSVDTRPIDHILQARMALKGIGASGATINGFTGTATGASGGKAGPADAALNIGMHLLDRPDLLPALYGKDYIGFQQRVTDAVGKESAFGQTTGAGKGKGAEANANIARQSALVHMLQNDLLEPTGAKAKLATGLLSGALILDPTGKVVQNPAFHPGG